MATLSESNKWSTTFEDLLVKEDGKEIEYTVQEVEVDDYESETEGDPENGFTIKNTHEVETIDIEVEKKWVDEDDQDGIRPDTPEEAVQPVPSEVPSSSPSGQDPWADPVDPAPAAETVPSPEETPASDPLFNTFGL